MKVIKGSFIFKIGVFFMITFSFSFAEFSLLLLLNIPI